MTSDSSPSPAVIEAAPIHSPEASIIDTVQSLIIAFVLAMTFRGFVTEGFVIPTGSMAPTLLGAHLLIHSDQTGSTGAVGLDQTGKAKPQLDRLIDPALGHKYQGSGPNAADFRATPRMGDRILVLKCLYPFFEPKRFDVVVFKNPTDPVGEAANYIKRLIGLPNEHIWLADGDVFTRPADGSGEFRVQRKPEHIQRAVWQNVFDSDLIPLDPERLNERMRNRYKGPPWSPRDGDWHIVGQREWQCDHARPTSITWDEGVRAIDDWTPYNMLGYSPVPLPVSDVRVSGAITASQQGLISTFELETRGHIFQWIVGDGKAIVRMRLADREGDWTQREAAISLPGPGRPMEVEFWHCDQALRLFINGREVLEPLPYDWTPTRRLQLATGDSESDDIDDLIDSSPLAPRMRWTFEGSPLSLQRVRVDRDLHYRHDMLDPWRQQKNQPHVSGRAFGTHPEENPAVLNADQFMMLGDNSQMSLDSRLWAARNPMVADLIDEAPFVVNRKLLLGKAWVVYFPAPYTLKPGGYPLVPDFGRLRFIR